MEFSWLMTVFCFVKKIYKVIGFKINPKRIIFETQHYSQILDCTNSNNKILDCTGSQVLL